MFINLKFPFTFFFKKKYLFFKKLKNFYMCKYFAFMCMYTMTMPVTHSGYKQALDPLELELQTVMSQVLLKSKCSNCWAIYLSSQEILNI